MKGNLLRYFSRSILCLLTISLLGCETYSQSKLISGEEGISAAAAGRKIYTEKCVNCHGRDALGSSKGPPLIHKIYEPGHHADASFYRAVKNGSKAHHWKFGDMPPIKHVSTEEVTKIIHYIRHEQRKVGIK